MIHFFCALPCEAEPLIRYFRLSRLNPFDLFPIYQSEDKRFSLVVTGIGRLNAAAAVAWHHACLTTGKADIRLNVGVAGHDSYPVGEIYLAHKIVERQSDKVWYPQIIFKPTIGSAALMTLDSPSMAYDEMLFDMEASGFYQMSLRLGHAELTHSLKIISDNTRQNTSTVSADRVKHLIAKRLGNINGVIEALTPLANEIAPSMLPEYQHFIEKWHFTQSQRTRLHRLLRQWSLHLPEQKPMRFASSLKSGREVLHKLQNTLNETGFSLHD